jgi:hypothetical protein
VFIFLFRLNCIFSTDMGSDSTVYIKDDNSVAVSSGRGNNRRITIIDIESQKVMKTISMDTYICGMAVRGKAIYYCTGYTLLKMLNLSDLSVSDIIQSNMSNICYVATSVDRLYYTDVNTLLNGVYCSAYLILSSCNIKQKSSTALIYF